MTKAKDTARRGALRDLAAGKRGGATPTSATSAGGAKVRVTVYLGADTLARLDAAVLQAKRTRRRASTSSWIETAILERLQREADRG